ncbi:MAG: hypothetical protein HOP19_00505 [Acidobacteria bacterium]|nr:hypothetical protein [Acidobacteriota bacterium]
MELIVSIPDKAAALLSAQNGDLARKVLEGYALESYRSGKLTTLQLQELLGFETGADTAAFLQRHGVPAPQATLTTKDSLIVSVQKKLREISQTEADWDSYGAQPTSLNAIRQAEELFALLVNRFHQSKGDKLLPYDVAPLPNGGVQLEWRGTNGALEVEIHPNAELRYLLVKGQGEQRQFQEDEKTSAAAIIELVSGIFE